MCKAVAPAITVLPTPPLPPKNMYFRPGLDRTNSLMLSSISFIMSSPPAVPVAVHLSCELLDHFQAGDIALHLRHITHHLRSQRLFDFVHVLRLHLNAV